LDLAGRNITERVREILADFLTAHGYELWNIEYIKAGKDYNLNVYIDSKKGIGTDDCEIVSRYLNERLDEEDLIEHNYYLIVSSPGMDRVLISDEHFARYIAAPVDVSLYKGVDGSKTYSGVLKGRTNEHLLIELNDSKELALPREFVSKVRLQVIF
jgi:ribosome maturation factor RimP